MSSKVPSKSSKDLLFLSLHRHKKKQVGTIFSNHSTPPPPGRPSTGKQIENLSRHHPRQPKPTKKGTPQSISYLTIKKKMINNLLTSLAHTRSIRHNHLSPPKIIYSQNFAQSRWPHKKDCPQRSSCMPHTLPRESPPFNTCQGSKEKLDRPLLEEIHHNLSATPCLTRAECNTWKKEAKTSTSQSLASLEKLHSTYWIHPTPHN
jgi:hypothetical protein